MRIRPFDALNKMRSTGDAAKAPSSGSASSSAGAAAPRDAAQIMGVPENELTPNVQRALLTLMGEVDQLRKDTERLRKRVRELESLADHDVLLPVLNRRAFVREVSRALALAERHQAPSALVYFDLNGFKQINDEYGHAAGDAALHHVAATLTGNLRETDSVGRLGGDEFGVVLTLTTVVQAEHKADELASEIQNTAFVHEGMELHINAAWGVHPLQPGVAVDAAMAQADAAMYARKQEIKAAADG
ncbi:GGDEF domain-containing protein [Hyphobacterium sp.]|uniref:GGDEF domain-containing protein n=1 Tax=Hyphobacterium sp. TaxID=2004662 RepID=UPI003BAB8B71